MPGTSNWDETNKIRLLLAILDTNGIVMSVGKWDTVSQKMGGTVTAEAARYFQLLSEFDIALLSLNRKKFGALKHDPAHQLLPVEAPSSLPSTPYPPTPTPAPRKRAASSTSGGSKTKKAKFTAESKTHDAELKLRVKGEDEQELSVSVEEDYDLGHHETAGGRNWKLFTFQALTNITESLTWSLTIIAQH